jgi:hypothetical protein
LNVKTRFQILNKTTKKVCTLLIISYKQVVVYLSWYYMKLEWTYYLLKLWSHLFHNFMWPKEQHSN